MKTQTHPANGTCLTTLGRAVRDERGGATLWNIFWLTGFMTMAGLTIDTTNARRIQTMMTSTADVASLAAVVELPQPHLMIEYKDMKADVEKAQDAANNFAVVNLDTSEHGDYFIKEDDVYVGYWDEELREFTWGGKADHPINAVKVFMGRHEQRGERINTTLLRTIGINHMNVAVTSTAVMEIPRCFRNGIVANNQVKMNSNATVYSGMCLHGQQGVDIQNNNEWWPDSGVSANFGAPINISPNQEDKDNVTGYDVPTARANQPASAMVYDVISVGVAMLDLNNNWINHGQYGYNPDYVHMRDPDMQDPSEPVIELDKYQLGGTVPESSSTTMLEDGTELAMVGGLSGLSAAGGSGGGCPQGFGNDDTLLMNGLRAEFARTCPGGILTEGRTYYAPCGSNNKVSMNGTYRNIVLVSECKVTIQNGSVLENVMLVVLDDGKHKTSIEKKAMNSGQGVRFGAKDQCADGGGVRMWIRGDYHSAASTEWYGAQVYVANDFHVAGQTEASNGLSAHVGNDVHITAQAELAGIDDSVSWDEAEQACPGNVGWDWITSDYHYVLVD